MVPGLEALDDGDALRDQDDPSPAGVRGVLRRFRRGRVPRLRLPARETPSKGEGWGTVLGAGFDAGGETGIAAALDVRSIVPSACALVDDGAVHAAELELPALRPVHGEEIAGEYLETKQKAQAEDETGAEIESQEQSCADGFAQETEAGSTADDDE